MVPQLEEGALLLHAIDGARYEESKGIESSSRVGWLLNVTFISGCNFNQHGMTIWEFEHFKHRINRKSNSSETISAHNHTGERNGRNESSHGAPRLGVDGIELSHLVGNQVR